MGLRGEDLGLAFLVVGVIQHHVFVKKVLIWSIVYSRLSNHLF